MPKKSPLSIDKETVKEFDIQEAHDLPLDQKLAFLQAQRQEMVSILWRERVNVIHANRLQNEDLEGLRNKGYENMTQHKSMVKQMRGGIDTINKLIEELEKEA